MGSVFKGLTSVPQVLAMMNEKLDWTNQLGEAFLAQPNDIQIAVQALRKQAEVTGSLKSSKEQKVSKIAAPANASYAGPAEYITIEPTEPDFIYVPVYDPIVVYGPDYWPPAYVPFFWYPRWWTVGPAFGFGAALFVAPAWYHYSWGHPGYAAIQTNTVLYSRFNKSVSLPAVNFKVGDSTRPTTATFRLETPTSSDSSGALARGLSRTPWVVKTFRGFKQAIACKTHALALPRKDCKPERSIPPFRPPRARRAFRLTRVQKAFRTAKAPKPFRQATFKGSSRAGVFKRTIAFNSPRQAGEGKAAIREKAKVKDRNSAAYFGGQRECLQSFSANRTLAKAKRGVGSNGFIDRLKRPTAEL